MEFCQNYLTQPWMAPRLVDGVYTFTGVRKPSLKTMLIDAETSTGEVTIHVLRNREKYLGMRINIGSEFISLEQIAETYSKVTGRPARYVQLSDEDFLKYNPSPFAIHIINAFKFFEEFGIVDGDAMDAKTIVPNLVNWEQFLNNHKAEFLSK